MANTRVLIADPDISLATVLSDYLASRGYDPHHQSQATAVLPELLSVHYDILLLEIKQGNTNGFQLLRQIRKELPLLPIIILTTISDRQAQINAFQLGCDDYQLKPFTMDILICRMEAILRRLRTQEENRQKIFQLGTAVFDSIHQTFDGQHLSGRQSELLLLLCRRQNMLVEKHFILTHLWNEDNAFTSKSLHVYINHLRTLLRPHRYQILASRGRGFKLVGPETQPSKQ